jgi:hypothetical protein
MLDGRTGGRKDGRSDGDYFYKRRRGIINYKITVLITFYFTFHFKNISGLVKKLFGLTTGPYGSYKTAIYLLINIYLTNFCLLYNSQEFVFQETWYLCNFLRQAKSSWEICFVLNSYWNSYMLHLC